MPLDPLQKVPATFLKDFEHLLTTDNGPHYDGEGKPFSGLVEDVSDGNKKPGIIGGQTLMIYPQEAYGQTYWHDPNGNQPSIFVGIGHVALPQDAGKSKEELIELGYQFHDKRSDFEPFHPLEYYQPVIKPAEAPVEQEEAQQELPSVPATPLVNEELQQNEEEHQ